MDYEKIKDRLKEDEIADYKYQERRHENWTENYQLYRDRVIINRLTQRQSINIPLIKGIVRTTLSNVDQFDEVEFDEKGNNKEKEIAFNEVWKDGVAKDKLEIKDTVSTKQVLIYGKSWERFNIIGGRITMEVREPFDFVVDRNSDPADLETARQITELHIFRTLGQLSANPLYDQAAVKRLKVYYATAQGLVSQEQITQALQDKNQRLEEMGLDSSNQQLGQTIVELKVYRFKEWDDVRQEDVVHVLVTAGPNAEILMAKPLQKVLGINEYDLNTWTDDPDRTDHYPDGVADTARNANKLLNSMISSLAENRILRNMGMQYYDSTAAENWSPAGFEPVPFGWYPLPGKPADIVQRVEIPDMTEAIDEMQYVKQVVESATAATTTLQGDTQQTKVTLGEVELAMGAAKERIGTLAKFKLLNQKARAEKWGKLMNANADKLEDIKLYKKSNKGNWFSKTVTPSMWKSTDGYECRVISSAEKEKKNTEGINKLNAVAQQFPGNPVMRKVYQKKLLDFGDINPDDAQAILEYEDQRELMMAQQQQMMQPPQVDPMAQSLDQQTQALQQLTQPNAGQITG